MKKIRAAAVQMSSGADRTKNLPRAEALVREAARRGAEFVGLPENFAVLAAEGLVIEDTEPVDGPIVQWGQALARELGIDLLLGSIPESTDTKRVRQNTSVLIDRDGALAAIYRKVHMFDVELGDLTLKESAVVRPGTELVTAELPWGMIGLSVCYDVRFAELYRALRFSGAELLTVPAAFTAQTGPSHWHLLLRARAVENQAFVFAPAQAGRHSSTRASYGHALIVDPWGDVLADAGEDDEGLAIADLDPGMLQHAAEKIPCLTHAKPWLLRGDRAAPSGSA